MSASFVYSDIDYRDFVMDKLETFIDGLELIWRRYCQLNDFLDPTHFDLVVFRSLSALASFDNPLLAFICREKNIPYLCWHHGGIGVYNRTPVTVDLPLAHHYFVYGDGVKKRLENACSEAIIHVAGSPKIEAFQKSYHKPRNDRKTLLYCIPQGNLHNMLHLRNSHPVFHFSYFSTVIQIVRLLVKYEERYRVIIKTSGDEFHSLIQSVLDDLDSKKVALLGKEDHFFRLLENSDLVILNWVSTSFWEAACTEADIFLLDEGPLTDEARATVSERAFFYSNRDEFLSGFQDYLDEGAFYQKSSDIFLERFLDLNAKNHRVEKVSNLFEKVLDQTELPVRWGSLTNY